MPRSIYNFPLKANHVTGDMIGPRGDGLFRVVNNNGVSGKVNEITGRVEISTTFSSADYAFFYKSLPSKNYLNITQLISNGREVGTGTPGIAIMPDTWTPAPDTRAVMNANWKIGVTCVLRADPQMSFQFMYYTPAAVRMYWNFSTNTWTNVSDNNTKLPTWDGVGTLYHKYDIFIERRAGYYKIFGRCLNPSGVAGIVSPFQTAPVPEGSIRNGTSFDFLSYGDFVNNDGSYMKNTIYHISYDYKQWRTR